MKKLLSMLGVFAFGTTIIPATLSTVACTNIEYTKEDYVALVKQISELDHSKYTSESMNNLLTVMAATAIEVEAGTNISQNYKKLKAAFDALVLIENETSDSTIYTLKDLFDSSIFDGDKMKIDIVFTSQEQYESVADSQSSLRRKIGITMREKAVSGKYYLMDTLMEEFNANKSEINKSLDVYHETTFIISKDLTNTIDNATVKATQIIVKYKFTIAS